MARPWTHICLGKSALGTPNLQVRGYDSYAENVSCAGHARCVGWTEGHTRVHALCERCGFNRLFFLAQQRSASVEKDQQTAYSSRDGQHTTTAHGQMECTLLLLSVYGRNATAHCIRHVHWPQAAARPTLLLRLQRDLATQGHTAKWNAYVEHACHSTGHATGHKVLHAQPHFCTCNSFACTRGAHTDQLIGQVGPRGMGDVWSEPVVLRHCWRCAH